MRKKLLFLLSVVTIWASSLSAQSLQKVVIEEFTGAWCGYCPDGALILEDILTQQPNAIGVSIHNGDAMYNSTGGLIESFFNPAFPQAVFNRNGAAISRGSWAGAANTALLGNPVVTVSIDSAGYNPTSRTLKVKVKAHFLRDTTGMLRLNVFLTEDDVTGTGTGYNQVNYYNGTSGHPYQGAGNPIVGFVHNHVFRDALGTAWGLNGSLPDSVFAGEDYTYTFTRTFASTSTWDITQMHIIGLVHMHGSPTRPILNAEEVPFSLATSMTGQVDQGLAVEVYPNPMRERCTIGFQVPTSGRVQVELFDLAGKRLRTLADDFANSGMHTVYFDGNDAAGQPLPQGLYLVRLRTEDGGSVAQRLMLAR